MVSVCRFSSFRYHFDLMKHLGFPGLSQRTREGNGLQFCVPMYPDNLQNWLDYDYGLFIFLLLPPLWLHGTGQMWDFWEILFHSWRTHGRKSLKFCMLMYPDHLQNCLDFSHGLLIYLLLAQYLLSKIWGPFLENTWEEWPAFWHADVSILRTH